MEIIAAVATNGFGSAGVSPAFLQQGTSSRRDALRGYSGGFHSIMLLLDSEPSVRNADYMAISTSSTPGMARISLRGASRIFCP